MPYPPRPFADRFWAKVDRVYLPSGELDHDACWNWRETCARTGKTRLYGYIRLPGTPPHGGRRISSPRAALLIAMGIPDDLLDQADLEYAELDAGHTHCDHPPCCNPSHLAWQVPLDNIREFVRKYGAFRAGAKLQFRARQHQLSLLEAEEVRNAS